jgi:hypothetical protein
MEAQEVMTIIDFSEDIATAEQPDPLPARDYPAEIKEVGIKVSNSSGKRYFSISFYVSPEDYPADYPLENNPDGRVLPYNRLMADDTPRNRFSLRKFTNIIGVPTGKRVDVTEWIGKSVTVTIGHKEWQGEIREEITAVKEA